MIFYGYTTKIFEGPLLSRVCSNCGTMNLRVYIAKKIFKLYGITCFPYSTSHEIICEKCGANHDVKQFNLESYDVKTPKRYFSGLILFSILFAVIGFFNYISDKDKQARTQEYLNNPLKGDIYVVKDKKDTRFPYHILKVTHIEADKTNFIMYRYAFEKLSTATRDIGHHKADDYGDEEFFLDKKEIKELEIKEINRISS